MVRVSRVLPGSISEEMGVLPGTELLTAGRLLRPQDVGLLSSIGHDSVAVVRQPRVRLVITGNELLPAGSTPRAHHITDANGPMLSALAERDGAVVQFPGLVRDEADAILEALQADADIVIVSGGSSVGVEDLAPMLVATHGELVIHGIAMRPSSPTGLGRMSHRLVFLLPGNPVSCLCAYDFFAGRAIRVMSGLAPDFPHRAVRATVARKIVSAIGRVDYCRVRLANGEVDPIALSGASILSSTTRADGFVIVPAQSEGYAPGSEITVYLYD
jgi:molybdopterin molybdotransferase